MPFITPPVRLHTGLSHPTWRDLLPAALRYASEGLHVFPCWPVSKASGCACGEKACGNAGKHPIGPLARHGLNSATVDPRLIKRWWGVFSTANIGIACGLSNLVVIDIDPRNGGDKTWAAIEKQLGKNIGRTMKVRTGSGGTHLYFRAPTRVALRSGSHALGPGVDLKSHGGYVIAPPSYHASGHFYVHEGGRLVPLPAPLRQLLRACVTHPSREPVNVASDPAAVRETKKELSRYLEGVRFYRPNQAVALCPVHDDRAPSLSIRVLPNGETLFHCFADCSYGDIMRALRERMGDD